MPREFLFSGEWLGREGADADVWYRRMKKHGTATGRAKHNHAAYRNEKHSLQGRTGKVCCLRDECGKGLG